MEEIPVVVIALTWFLVLEKVLIIWARAHQKYSSSQSLSCCTRVKEFSPLCCLLGVLWKKISGFFHVSHLGVQRSLEAGGDADGTWKIKDSSSSAGSRLVPARSNSSTISIHWGIRWCNSVCLLMFNRSIERLNDLHTFSHAWLCV